MRLGEWGKAGGGDSVERNPPTAGRSGVCGPRGPVSLLAGIEVQTCWRVWFLVPRPDCRRYVCDRCRRAVYICSWCDRGQRYCSDRCRDWARRRSLRAAGRRYQQTRRGRRLHARRQQAYRERQRKKVTHHSCRSPGASATVVACARKPVVRHRAAVPGARRGRELFCVACGEACAALIRHDFLRCRRPWRARGGAARDLRATGRRDPSPG